MLTLKQQWGLKQTTKKENPEEIEQHAEIIAMPDFCAHSI
jgi:hypothetical protein